MGHSKTALNEQNEPLGVPVYAVGHGAIALSNGPLWG